MLPRVRILHNYTNSLFLLSQPTYWTYIKTTEIDNTKGTRNEGIRKLVYFDSFVSTHRQCNLGLATDAADTIAAVKLSRL